MAKKANTREAVAKEALQLTVFNACTASIDVGSMMMMIAYTDRQGHQQLLEVGAYTQDLQRLAAILQEAGVTHVAMESTGVYWMCLFEVLEDAGLTVMVVNPRHFKNVAAQKTDVKDCQFLQQLHAHGMLRASHLAQEQYRELRSYIHERNLLQQHKATTLNRVHKVLTLMNIKFQHIISDIEGVNGMKLVRGIASGIADPATLLSLIDADKLKASKEELLVSLEGLHKKHYVHILQQTLVAYDFYVGQMKQYEDRIEEVLKRMLSKNEQGQPPTIARKGTKARKNQYHFNLKEYLHQIIGVDLTAIDGIDEICVLTIMSVTGLNMNKWPSAAHFASWLGLSPCFKKSGGKMLGHQKKNTANMATQMFKLAAQTMWQNKGPLGHLYRRLAAQKGSGKAIKAIARKLAVIFYHMIKNQTAYDKTRVEEDAERQRTKRITRLKREAAKLGMEVQFVKC